MDNILNKQAEVKAKEILGRYFDFVCPAKQNAIICVDIILSIVPYESHIDGHAFYESADFWRLVKSKIEQYEN